MREVGVGCGVVVEGSSLLLAVEMSEVRWGGGFEEMDSLRRMMESGWD